MEKEVMMNGENVREAYEAPKCEVIEMQNEGTILSASLQTGGSSIDGFGSSNYEGGWN